MPEDLVSFIKECTSTPLHRRPFFVPQENTAPERVTRVNPKKIHEVFTMSSYVGEQFGDHTIKPCIVDVGAGQGYLSRALSASPNNFHVLALDSNNEQTTGSISRNDWLEAPSQATGGDNTRGTITHKTTHIGSITSLSNAIEEWVSSSPINAPPSSRIPIVLVGLHCCGDLTPSILRFIRHSHLEPHEKFEIVGCVVVGCCYNMCEPTTFPLSQKVKAEIGSDPLRLHVQHLHLATQSPLTWSLDIPSSTPLPITASLNTSTPTAISPRSAREWRFAPLTDPTTLSVRKVTYRALLSRRLPILLRAEKDARPTEVEDVDWRKNRVGRLGNTAYSDFPTFLKNAKRKLGLNEEMLQKAGADLESDLNQEERELARSLEVFYVLRCLTGPIVESLIALDRYAFLQESVNSQSQGDVESSGTVELVNLFDQFTGSLRNLALVWRKDGESE